MSIYDNNASKICSDLNPTAPSQQEVNPQNYSLAKISEVEAYLLDKIGVQERQVKKIQYNHKHHEYRSNSINSYYWGSFYWCIHKWC